MNLGKWILAGVCLAGVGLAPVASAQKCNSSQNAAVECFVYNAVQTNLTSLRYGMTLPEFQDYGVSISKILESPQAYIVLGGVAAAIADAMPPTNANGSSNAAAQDAAIKSIVDAEVSNGLVTVPTGATQQDLIWFTEDMVNDMNQNGGILMSPGLVLRVIDTYVTAATSNGSVTWTQVDTNISGLVTSLQNGGLLKLPANLTTAQVTAFAQSVARTIYTYTSATSRASL